MTSALVILCALMLIVAGRLLQLQGVDAAAYAAQGEDLRLREKVLPAERGAITDVNGTKLAYSVQTRTVFADPPMISDADRPAVAELISAKLELPYSEVMMALTAPGRYSIIARDVDPQVANEILQAQIPDDSADGSHRITGIGIERTQKRVYPSGPTGGQLVGFVNRDGSGLAGVEQTMNTLLSGKDGRLLYEASPGGAIIPAGIQEETDAEPGSTIALTIDADIQYLVQDAVLDYQAKTGAAAVSIVALDAKTGQVVAMFATPGYDPGIPGQTDPANLGNPALSNVFEPGSTNKVTTLGPALNEDIITPDTVLTAPGSLPVADVIVRDAWPHGDLQMTATGVLAKSSNTGTLLINEQLEDQQYYEYLKEFGIGTKTGIELPGESAGILAPRETWSGSQVGNVPIGQGVSMTTLQLASIYQAIANDGARVPPRIISAITGADGETTQLPTPEAVPVLDAQAAQDLRGMLEAVTGPGGTGKAAVVPGYRVGGKTGTAQRANPDCGCYNGGGYYHTFAGMAPIEDPRYVVAISVTDPTVTVKGGASPLFATVMGQILQSRAVPPSDGPSPEYTLLEGE